MKEWSEEEITSQLRRYNSGEDEPPWQGAVPDTDKLDASIQTDPYGLWWRGARCDFCIYEAAILIQDTYLCEAHTYLAGLAKN